jgi:hypothetical protein
MGFSSILDISSFFIGMIINLIFVALMCYYFKRKYDYLEVAQNEQAKILYQLIHKPMKLETCPTPSMDFTRDPLVNPIVDSRSGSDSDSDSDSDSESDEEREEIEVFPETNENDNIQAEIIELVDEIKTVELDKSFNLSVEEVKHEDSLDITIQLSDNETNYSKMSMKQLKEVLSSKGIKAKNNMKKDELLELITNEINA